MVGKPEGKKPLGKPRRRWEYNIKPELQDVRWWGHGLDLSGSGYGQMAGPCKCRNELTGYIK
jgi:hypothetical protein